MMAMPERNFGKTSDGLEITKYMRKPIASKDWTDEQIKQYYEKRSKIDEEIRTIGKEQRQRNGGGFSKPELIED